MVCDFDRRGALKASAGAGLAAVGGLGLLASACAPKAQAGLPVRVLSAQGTLTVTLQSLMNAKGYFKKFGLVPQSIAVASGTNIIGPLLNGEADICIFAGFSQLLTAIEKGADLKIVAGASVGGQQAMFSKNPQVQSVKDLEGRTVGVGAIGAQLHQVALALLKKKGVDTSKVTFVTIGNSNDVFKAVESGRVDAGNGEADVLADLDRYGVHMLKDGDYATQLPEYTWQASFTSTQAIKDKREPLVRTLEAYCKAYRYVQHPGSKDDFVAAQLAALTPRDMAAATARAVSQWNYMQAHRNFAEDLVLSPERVDYMQELNIQLGNQKRKLPYDQLIDLSLAKEAVARLDKA